MPKVGVITGRHPFDVIGFHRLFRSFETLDTYICHMDDYAFNGDSFDVLVFYNMHGDIPSEQGNSYEQKARSLLESLGRDGKGIVVLHHAILAYPKWSHWSELVGIEDRSFDYHIGQQFQVEVANSEHAITNQMLDWDMVDETYTMDDAQEDKGNTILLSVEHAKSMKHIAWTRQFRNSRVLCFQSGHDDQTWSNPAFRQFLQRGIQWCSGLSACSQSG